MQTAIMISHKAEVPHQIYARFSTMDLGTINQLLTASAMDVFLSFSIVMLPAWKQNTPMIIAVTELIKDTCQ